MGARGIGEYSNKNKDVDAEGAQVKGILILMRIGGCIT